MDAELALLRLRFGQEQAVLRQAYAVYANKFGVAWAPADVDAFFRPYALGDGAARPRSAAAARRPPPAPARADAQTDQ
jgi:hypothetical protein